MFTPNKSVPGNEMLLRPSSAGKPMSSALKERLKRCGRYHSSPLTLNNKHSAMGCQPVDENPSYKSCHSDSPFYIRIKPDDATNVSAPLDLIADKTTKDIQTDLSMRRNNSSRLDNTKDYNPSDVLFQRKVDGYCQKYNLTDVTIVSSSKDNRLNKLAHTSREIVSVLPDSNQWTAHLNEDLVSNSVCDKRTINVRADSLPDELDYQGDVHTSSVGDHVVPESMSGVLKHHRDDDYLDKHSKFNMILPHSQGFTLESPEHRLSRNLNEDANLNNFRASISTTPQQKIRSHSDTNSETPCSPKVLNTDKNTLCIPPSCSSEPSEIGDLFDVRRDGEHLYLKEIQNGCLTPTVNHILKCVSPSSIPSDFIDPDKIGSEPREDVKVCVPQDMPSVGNTHIGFEDCLSDDSATCVVHNLVQKCEQEGNSHCTKDVSLPILLSDTLPDHSHNKADDEQCSPTYSPLDSVHGCYTPLSTSSTPDYSIPCLALGAVENNTIEITQPTPTPLSLSIQPSSLPVLVKPDTNGTQTDSADVSLLPQMESLNRITNSHYDDNVRTPPVVEKDEQILSPQALTKRKEQLLKIISERKETLRKLHMVKVYREKNDLPQMLSLIATWRKACQHGILDLHNHLKQNNVSVLDVIHSLRLSTKTVHYDEDKEEFY